MGFPPLRAVVLDNNGTCFDDLRVAYGSACATLRAFGVTRMPTLQQYRDEMSSKWREWYWKYGIPTDVTGDQMNTVRRPYYAEHGHEAKYRQDVEPFLAAFRFAGLKVAMVSSEIDSVLRRFLADAGLTGYFKGYIRGEAWPKQPGLLAMLYDLGLNGGEAVYVDDSEDGLAAAKALRMRTIGFVHPTAYCSEERIRAVGPDALAKDFTDVGRIVSAWL